MNIDNLNTKYVLLGVGGLVILIGLAAVVMQRQNSASGSSAATASFSPAAGLPGRASGYKGAELMPAPPGGSVPASSTAAAPIGHATGYQNSNLMPAPPGGAGGAGGAGGSSNPSAPAHATGYQNANLMPAPR
jgi:hypothetical protein